MTVDLATLWETDAAGIYLDQSPEAAAERIRLGEEAYQHERGLPHNRAAAGVWFGMLAFDTATPPNGWCHACGHNLNSMSTVTPTGRSFENLNFTRKARLVVVTDADGNIRHDCARDAGL